MTEWADRALVLRMGHFRESDLWLRMLSRRHGLLTLFAFGGSRSRRRFCGCLDIFNSLHCRVRAGRSGFLNLEEAVLLGGPKVLRKDWRRMGLAVNCLRFVEALGVPPEGADDAYALVEDLRVTLESASVLPALLPLFFRLRLAGALGFAPDLGRCGLCGASLSGGGQFVVDEGHVRCASCRAAAGGARYGVDMDADGLDLLRHVQQEWPSGWRTGDLPAAVRHACARAIDGFVQYHLGLAWEGGHFRKV